MNVAIIGGFLGGLAAGIVLRDLGHEIRIYEKSAGLMDDRGAGIGMQPETPFDLLSSAHVFQRNPVGHSRRTCNVGSAMSRALNRLRATFGDPLLVRSDG